MGACCARAYAFVLRVQVGKSGGVERQDDGGQEDPHRSQEQKRAATAPVSCSRSHPRSHLGPMLHLEHLPSVTKTVTRRSRPKAYFLERRKAEVGLPRR